MPTPTTAPSPRAAMRWLGFAAVVIPLAILLAPQFRALAELEETSVASQRLALKGYARAVLRTTEAFYRKKADDALVVPAGLLDAGRGAGLAAHFSEAGGD